jgi:hypothetical protein
VDPLSIVDFARDRLVVRPFRPTVSYDIWVVIPSFREVSLGTQALIFHVRTRLAARLAEIAATIETH